MDGDNSGVGGSGDCWQCSFFVGGGQWNGAVRSGFGDDEGGCGDEETVVILVLVIMVLLLMAGN